MSFTIRNVLPCSHNDQGEYIGVYVSGNPKL